MSDIEGGGFAFIRKPECEALRRCKPSAAMALIYIRSVLAQREDQPFLCGSRDFDGCGMGRDAAASALQDLEREGVIRCEDRGNFTRGKKASWRLVHTRENEKITAGKPANCKTNTAGKPANSGRKTRQLGENTAGKPATPKETSSTSSQKSKEEEVSALSESETARASERQALRERLLRIDKAAKAVALAERSFIEKAGGLEPADLLARMWERGNLTPQQLRARLYAGEAGTCEKNGTTFESCSYQQRDQVTAACQIHEGHKPGMGVCS